MKKNLLFFLLVFGVTLAITQACKKDPVNTNVCDTKDCGFGDCDSTLQACVCDAGYEYDADGSCKTETREKLIGEYKIAETDPTCSSDPTPYLVNFTKVTTDVTKVTISNFWATGADVDASVSSDSRLTIAAQDLGTDFHIDSATGTFAAVSGKIQITMSYTITEKSSGNKAICTNVLWQQQ